MSTQSSGSKGPRILLVDDQAPFRRVLARRLTRRNLEVLQADKGEAGLALLTRHPLDIVILDVKMPGMGGMATLKHIQRLAEPPPVILLTGNAALEDGVEGIKAGAFDYLTKPVEMDHLMVKIRQALEISTMEKQIIRSERLAVIGTLSTGIAHEINTPLAVIQEAVLAMKQVLETQAHEVRPLLEVALEKIQTNVTRAGEVTHQLLGYGKEPPSRGQAQDLGAVIKGLEPLLQKELKARQVTLRYPPSIRPRVAGSATAVRQILLNVLTNAAQAASPKSEIRIRARSVKDRLILEIRDQGPGIAPAHLERIFDPFFTTKPWDRGTGLGLFVVHKLMTQISGKVQVESRPGKGTCVALDFVRYLELPQGDPQ